MADLRQFRPSLRQLRGRFQLKPRQLPLREAWQLPMKGQLRMRASQLEKARPPVPLLPSWGALASHDVAALLPLNARLPSLALPK
jgi:hypothetical protein